MKGEQERAAQALVNRIPGATIVNGNQVRLPPNMADQFDQIQRQFQIEWKGQQGEQFDIVPDEGDPTLLSFVARGGNTATS